MTKNHMLIFVFVSLLLYHDLELLFCIRSWLARKIYPVLSVKRCEVLSDFVFFPQAFVSPDTSVYFLVFTCLYEINRLGLLDSFMLSLCLCFDAGLATWLMISWATCNKHNTEFKLVFFNRTCTEVWPVKIFQKPKSTWSKNRFLKGKCSVMWLRSTFSFQVPSLRFIVMFQWKKFYTAILTDTMQIAIRIE